MDKDTFRNAKLAVKFIEHSYAGYPEEIQNIASSSFQTGASIVESRYAEAEDILLELAQLHKKQGKYLMTRKNGTEEYAPGNWDDEEVYELIHRAFEWCYD